MSIKVIKTPLGVEEVVFMKPVSAKALNEFFGKEKIEIVHENRESENEERIFPPNTSGHWAQKHNAELRELQRTELELQELKKEVESEKEGK